MSTDMVIVFIFFAGPIRVYSPGGRVNNSYSHGRRGNSHFVSKMAVFLSETHQEKTCLCHMRTTKAQISLISAFAVHCLDSIPILAIAKISSL